MSELKSNNIMIVGLIPAETTGKIFIQNSSVYDIKGVSRTLLSRDYKDAIKILVKGK